jgi:hypothetical protein
MGAHFKHLHLFNPYNVIYEGSNELDFITYLTLIID